QFHANPPADDVVRFYDRLARLERSSDAAVEIRLRKGDSLCAIRRVDHAGNQYVHSAGGESGNDAPKGDCLKNQFHAHAASYLVTNIHIETNLLASLDKSERGITERIGRRHDTRSFDLLQRGLGPCRGCAK